MPTGKLARIAATLSLYITDLTGLIRSHIAERFFALRLAIRAADVRMYF